MSNIISIKSSFSPYTGLRHSNVSENSGEDFYHNILNSFFKENAEKGLSIIVDLDGVRGYSPSFIDEAFGNLVFDFGKELIEKFLTIKSDDKPFWIKAIQDETFNAWEGRRKKRDMPKKTKVHPDWWGFDGVKFKKVTSYVS